MPSKKEKQLKNLGMYFSYLEANLRLFFFAFGYGRTCSLKCRTDFCREQFSCDDVPTWHKQLDQSAKIPLHLWREP